MVVTAVTDGDDMVVGVVLCERKEMSDSYTVDGVI